jgi:hypothetical protein
MSCQPYCPGTVRCCTLGKFLNRSFFYSSNRKNNYAAQKAHEAVFEKNINQPNRSRFGDPRKCSGGRKRNA